MKMWILHSAIGNENVSPVCAKTEKKQKTQINGQRGGSHCSSVPTACPHPPAVPGEKERIGLTPASCKPEIKAASGSNYIS